MGLEPPSLVSDLRTPHSIADKVYMLHISTLDKVREEWQNEHIKACEVPGTQTGMGSHLGEGRSSS